MTTDEARAFYMDLCAKLSTGLAQSEETIAEQQREIERLENNLETLKEWVLANHTDDCDRDQWNEPEFTCGINEVFKP